MPPPEEAEEGPPPRDLKEWPRVAERKEAPPPKEAPPKTAPPRSPAVVYLKSGGRFEGDLVDDKPDSVTLLTSRGKMTFSRKQIEKIQKGGAAEAPPPPPADSGPAEAYLRFHAAMLAGDLEGIRKQLPEAKRKELEDPQTKAKLALASAFLPKQVEVVSAKTEGDASSLAVREKGGDGRKGTIGMVREEGEWRVDAMSWEMGEMKP